MQICVCGLGRSGTTLFYNMLRHAVSSHRFLDDEAPCTGVRGNFITKRPSDVFSAGGPKRIIMFRDFRDVITSKHASVPDKYFYGMDYVLTSSGDPTPHGVIQVMEAVRRHDNPVIVRYEDLVTNPDEVQERLGRYFKYKARFTDFYKSDIPKGLVGPLNGIRPVSASNIGRWKNHKDRITQQYCPELEDLLIEWGYETDRHWYARAFGKPRPIAS